MTAVMSNLLPAYRRSSPPLTPGRVSELRCGGDSRCDAANLHHTSIHSPYLVPTLPCHTSSPATTSAQLLTNLLIFSRIGCPHLVSINRAVSVGVSWHSAYKLMPYCHWVIISVFGFGIGSNVRLLFGFGYRPNFSISDIIRSDRVDETTISNAPAQMQSCNDVI